MVKTLLDAKIEWSWVQIPPMEKLIFQILFIFKILKEILILK